MSMLQAFGVSERERRKRREAKTFPLIFPSIADSFSLPPPRQRCHVSPDSEPPPRGVHLYSPVSFNRSPPRSRAVEASCGYRYGSRVQQSQPQRPRRRRWGDGKRNGRCIWQCQQ